MSRREERLWERARSYLAAGNNDAARIALESLLQHMPNSAAVNLQLADPATYASPDRDRISELNAAHARLEAKVAELEESWLELEMAMGE